MKMLQEAEDKKKADQGPQKLTGTQVLNQSSNSQDHVGKQLFEQNKALATSDAIFYNDSGVAIDEKLFEDLEDLEIEEESPSDNQND